jgi:hypothetical protein
MSPNFTIVNPCPKKWADLRDDGGTRYCDDGKTSVHRIEQYTQEEMVRIWDESGGHMCGCLRESAPEPRSRRAILVGALLTAISPLMAQTGRVRIRVMDATKAVIPAAEISVLGPDGKPSQTVTANEVGEAVLLDLPIGDNRFVAVAPGFVQRRFTVVIQNSDEVRVDTILEVGATTMGGLIVIASKRRRWLIFG